ncbi:MAG TPA: Flp pilus assembly protein CpaB [Tepidisphaeraceae bacterium]|jgi:pilus assembly protein CpaB
MNPKALIPIVAAVFMGLIAAVLARQVIGSRGPAASHAPIVRVVVAKAEIPPGHALTADDLSLAPIVAAAPPPNGFTDTAGPVGRVTRAPLIAGQPVLEPLLAPQGTPDGLQALVPEGMRAITLETTESSGLAGLLTPGSRVDVVTTAAPGNDADRAVSRIIAQNVRVVAVGQQLSSTTPAKPADPAAPAPPPGAAARTVTLLVTPHEAAELDLAQSMARLRLILRGNGDTQEVDDDAVMLAELRGGTATPVPVVVPVVQQATPAPATQPAVVPAATQPAIPPAVPAEPARRIVTLILGDKEQRLSFREQSKTADPEVSDAKDPFANP